MICAWARHLAREPDDMRVGIAAYVRIKALTRIFSGSRASYTPGRAPLCPKRSPPQPQPPVVNVFHRGGLRFGHRTALNRDITTAQRGDLHH